MKTRMALVLALLLLALAGFAGPAAAETKMVGVIEKIELVGATAKVVVKDNKTDEEVKVLVKDELTLEKFKDHRIVEGDEVRVKFVVEGDQNVTTYFRKTAGC